MKTLITFLILVCFAAISQGEVYRIKVITTSKKAQELISYPTAIISPGEVTSIDLTEPFTQDAKLGSLPVGVKIDAIANIEDQKISYSVLVTIRKHKQSAGSLLEQATSTFATHELMLSGVTNPNEKIEAKIDENTIFFVSFATTKEEKEKK